MIPKIIHYCWFGKNPLPKLAKKCIRSWKKYCADYKIIKWNEENFDISSAPQYVQQAYKAKKWAFVTDYVRLKVVYDYGGIYLDTDVEIIKGIDHLLCNKAFFGFQDNNSIATGLGFGSNKHTEILYKMMQDYSNILFINEDGEFDLTACPERNSHVFNDFGFILNGKTQKINDITVFSKEFFCPKDWLTGELIITENTYTIHHFSASWYDKQQIEYLKQYKKRQKRMKIKSFHNDVQNVKKEKGMMYSILWGMKNFWKI